MDIREIGLNLTIPQINNIFNAYYNYLGHNNFTNNIRFDITPGGINVFVIRMNSIYVTNDMKRNNDWMFIYQNEIPGKQKSYNYVFQVTADPKTRKYRIANILPQIYGGNIRNHRWIFGRLAICQDNYKVWVRRFDKNEKDFVDEKGFFGINIHDNAGMFNSSLGCVILANQSSYSNMFFPLLKEIKSIQKIIPVCVFQDNIFLNLYNNLI